MFLHLGGAAVVFHRDVVGIFDLDNTTSSRITREFLERAEKAGRVVSVGEDLPKSFLVCRDGKTGEETVYLSQLSPATLLKRVESGVGVV